ncbi:MAG: ABC transporter substrate-binding protein [Lachnospiraceae bacterium]|nr:ABC transporter substrate-binding protein [Lachnospiraceae bacterium]
MRKGKKIVSAMMMAAMMMSTLLTACGSAEEASGSSAEKETAKEVVSEEAAAAETVVEEAAPEVQELEPVELVVFINQFTGTDDAVVAEAVNNLDAVKDLNVTVKFKTLNEGDNFFNEVDLALVSGEKIDIIMGDSGASHFPVASADGAYADLTELLQTKYTTLYNTLREDHWKAATVNGAIYGVPCYKEGCLKWGFYIPHDFVEKYDIDLSGRTIFEIDDILEKLKEDGREGLMLTYSQASWYMGSAYQAKYRNLYGNLACMSIENPGTVENWFMTDTYRELAHQAKEWYEKGYLPEDILTVENFDVEKFDADVFGLETVTYFPGREYQESANRGFELDFLAMTPYINVLDDPGWVQTITSSCEDVDRALAFLEVLNTVPEVKNTFTYGVEGVHYDLTEAGQVDYTNYPDHADVWNGDSSRMGNMLIGYSPVGFPEEGYAIFDEAMEEAVDIPTIGFRANTESISNEYAAMTAIVSEYNNLLLSGTVEDVDATVDEFVAKLEAAGAQKVLDEIQAQWDAFEASK